MQDIDPILEHKKERTQKFYARVTGALSGVTAGAFAGARLAEASLLRRLRRMLYQRDWLEGFDRPEWAKNIISVEHAPQPSPDPLVKRAYEDIYKKNNKIIADAKAALQEALKELGKSKDKRLKDAEEILASARERLTQEGAVDIEGALKGPRNKWERTGEKIENQFRYLTERARETHFDRPILREMMKSGKEPGHMGLQFRHADNKSGILLFSLVTAVSVGSLAYAGVRWLQHTRDTIHAKHENAHAMRVTAEREAALGQSSTGSSLS